MSLLQFIPFASVQQDVEVVMEIVVETAAAPFNARNDSGQGKKMENKKQ